MIEIYKSQSDWFLVQGGSVNVVPAMRNWLKGARSNNRDESDRNSGILRDTLGKCSIST